MQCSECSIYLKFFLSKKILHAAAVSLPKIPIHVRLPILLLAVPKVREGQQKKLAVVQSLEILLFKSILSTTFLLLQQTLFCFRDDSDSGNNFFGVTDFEMILQIESPKLLIA